MKVVITHWVHDEITSYLEQFALVSRPTEQGVVWPKQRIIQESADADALITCMADSVDDAFLEQCPQLKIVAATLKGYDNYDADACARRGVWLTIVPETIIAPTAELALSLTLAVMRNVNQGDEIVRRGHYDGWRPQLYGRSLYGSVVGIVGFGQLGQSVARLLEPFGLSGLLYFDEHEVQGQHTGTLKTKYIDLETLLKQSDMIILTLPLTSSTHHLINIKTLSHLRPGCYLVNIGRGSVVDEQAILSALESGRLAGYAADVFEMEDWALSSRPASIPEKLRTHPRTVFTPHLGSAVDDVRRDMSMASARQVQKALLGLVPEHAVNIPV